MRSSDTIRDWLSSRWNGPREAAAFLNKPLPRNVGWLHTLGSLLLVYLTFQMLTGILLGFYYSPGIESAYDSVRYIREELLLGEFIANLHRYGSGFVLVTVFLHLLRSYMLGAYQKPRELLWISGLLAGILLTLFAFTGQLLPFDQRGYWATVVGIEIASGAPILGESVRNLLTGGYGDIGAVTLSRFYILHVCVLPLALVGLVGLHLGILQKTGSAGPADGSSPDPVRTFYPGQALKDVLAAAAGALALCVVSVWVTTHNTGPANPAATGFTPRPEWYFLAHYELLRLLPGGLQVVGTFLLPNLLVGLLMAAPFLDRSGDRHWRSRKGWVGGGVLVTLAIVVLTAQGIANEPDHVLADEGGQDQITGPEMLDEQRCMKCHMIDGLEGGGDRGPNLTHVGSRLQQEYIRDWIRNPQRFKPQSEMPAFEGTESELDVLVAYLLTLD